jgi:two-component system, chemotaxis family, chemotaxis protein CheY
VAEPAGKRVLVVDDASLVRMYYRDALERAGYVVDEALNGLEALEKLHEAPADLLIVDVNMPQMDGFTFLKRMRMIPHCAATPVVLLTTSGLRRDAQEAMASSAVSYVIKPPGFAQLQARLDTAIRRTIAGDWRRPSC